MALLLVALLAWERSDNPVWPVVQAFVPTIVRGHVLSPWVAKEMDAFINNKYGSPQRPADRICRPTGWPKTCLSAQSFAITSCLEALDNIAADVAKNHDTTVNQTMPISWWDPVHESANAPPVMMDASHQQVEEVPLYPLPAVYLPTGDAINYTLNNVEPRNIQMVLDLQDKMQPSQPSLEQDGVASQQQQNNSPCVCVALRAIDSGRLARVGTLMRVIDLHVVEDTAPVLKSSTAISTSAATNSATINDTSANASPKINTADDSLQVKSFPRKIVVTCVAESTVQIQSVLNPQSLTLEHRLRHPREYVMAKVVLPPSRHQNNQNSKDDQTTTPQQIQLQEQAAHAYQSVRQKYMDGAFDDLPLFEHWTLALPPLTADDFGRESSWTGPLLWQSLCHTIREGYQRGLAAERNEMLVAAAVGRGGMLQLPVQLEDILPEDQQAVRALEQSMQTEWTQLKLDPILDFQRLLELDYAWQERGGVEDKGADERLQYLVTLLSRELQRLEQPSAHQIRLQQQRYERQKTAAEAEPEPPRKGAWFDDGVW